MPNDSPFSISKREYKIPPIPTKYNNRTYRCRLEAKWAVFFSGCLLEARYEAEGYDINGEWYLPDFWIPEYEMFVEIKPDPPTEKEIRLAAGLRRITGKWVVIFHGFPGVNEGDLFAWDETHSGAGEGEYRIKICSSSVKSTILWFCSDEKSNDIFRSSEWDFAGIYDTRDAFSGPVLMDCMRHSADCRFEHGADPTPPWVKAHARSTAIFHPNDPRLPWLR